MKTLRGPIQLRAKTAEELTTENPILLEGQFAFETDTTQEVDNIVYLKAKKGPGSWNDLKYVQIGAPVESFSGSYNDLTDKPTMIDGSDYVSKNNIKSGVLVSASTIVWDCSINGFAKLTLTGPGGARTIAAPTNAVSGLFYTIEITQGSNNVFLNWNSIFKFPDNKAGFLKSGIGVTTRWHFRYDGANFVYVSGGYGDYRLMEGDLIVKTNASDGVYASVSGRSVGMQNDEGQSLSLGYDEDLEDLALASFKSNGVVAIVFEENPSLGTTRVMVPNQGGKLAVINIDADFADDAAAASGGVPVGGFYHNAGALRVRLS